MLEMGGGTRKRGKADHEHGQYSGRWAQLVSDAARAIDHHSFLETNRKSRQLSCFRFVFEPMRDGRVNVSRFLWLIRILISTNIYIITYMIVLAYESSE